MYVSFVCIKHILRMQKVVNLCHKWRFFGSDFENLIMLSNAEFTFKLCSTVTQSGNMF